MLLVADPRRCGALLPADLRRSTGPSPATSGLAAAGGSCAWEDGRRSRVWAAQAALLAGAAVTSRRFPLLQSRRQRASSKLCRNAKSLPTKKVLADAQKALKEEQTQAAIERATPVPQSFDQAVAWATTATLKAAQAGRLRQTMYFSAGESDSSVSGELGNVLAFAEQFCKTLAVAPTLEGGKVRVLFSDAGASSLAASKWEPLPEALAVDYLPPAVWQTMNKTVDNSEKLLTMIDAEVLVVLAASQLELPAIIDLLDRIERAGRDIPCVFINPRLLQNPFLAAGSLMKRYRALERTLVPVFHLEQWDPEGDDPTLNSCVVTRVWPRPFAVWEDNPEDPDATDGYFLMDMDERGAPDPENLQNLLMQSRDVRNLLEEKRRRDRAPPVRAK